MLNRRQFLGFSVPALLYPVLFRNRIPGEEFNVNEIILTEEALRIHRSALVIDGHNDLPSRMKSLLFRQYFRLYQSFF